MVGLDGEDGVHVQSAVEEEPNQGQSHVTAPVHNMEETTVQEILQSVRTVTFILVQVSNQGKLYAK